MKQNYCQIGLLALTIAIIFGGTTSSAFAQYRVRGVGSSSGQNLSGGLLHSVPGLTDVINIAANGDHTLALKTDGTVWEMGEGRSGMPVGYPVQIPGLTGVVAIAVGNESDLALKADGTVWSWGDNTVGQLGDGTNINRTDPVQVAGLSDVVSVACGFWHCLAVRRDGTVYAWGYNYSGQLGDGTRLDRSSPVQVGGLTNVVTVAGGGAHSLALKSDGTVWAWGADSDGQLGDGIVAFSRPVPTQVPSLINVQAISAGGFHSLAVTTDGILFAWGYNAFGQLGNFTTEDKHSPEPILFRTNQSIRAIVCGAYHSLALDSQGAVYAWGYNNDGQLGDGTTVERHSPVPMPYSGYAKSIAAGFKHSIVLAPDTDPDFNRDGIHDFVWQNTQTGDVTAAFLHGANWDGSFGYLGQGIPTAWQIVGTGDFNADGKTDLIWQNTQTGDVSYWLMNGTTRIDADLINHITIPLEWKIVGVADINRDGNPDLVWQDTQTGDAIVWYMNGVTWTGNYDYLARSVPTEWRIAGTGDLNGDNMPDIVWQNTQTGDVVYWLMNGSAMMASDYIAHNVPLNLTVVGLEDINPSTGAQNTDQNDDLMPDLILRDSLTGDVQVWYMKGTTLSGGTGTIAHGIPPEWSLAPSH